MSTLTRRQPTGTGPWCWQQKLALRLIRDRMNGDSKAVYVLSTYHALTEIASDEAAETFKTSHPYLAGKAGCSVSQMKLALEELVGAGLILIETPKLRGPCSFTLLAVPEIDSVSRNGTNDSHITASVSHKANLSAMATVEESSEESIEEILKNEAEEIVEAWNKTELTRCKQLTPERSSHLIERLKSTFWREHWRTGLEIITATPFCCGQNDRGP